MFSLPASCSSALLFRSAQRPLPELCPEGLVLLKIRFPPLSLQLLLSAPAGAEPQKPARSSLGFFISGTLYDSTTYWLLPEPAAASLI